MPLGAQASSGPKDISSTDGMQETVNTSPLVKYRADEVVNKRMTAIEDAILRRDFGTFAEITMKARRLARRAAGQS